MTGSRSGVRRNILPEGENIAGGIAVERGISILGTLATNIWIFTHPDGDHDPVADRELIIR